MSVEPVVVSAPLRLSLGGGGCDLPEYYLEHSADVLAVAIDRRIEVVVRPAQRPDGPADPRVALLREHIDLPVSVGVRSPVAPGSGLGGSGALTVALLAACDLFRGVRPAHLDPLSLALRAYDWERRRLGERVGFQDQTASAFGSVTRMTADRRGRLSVTREEDLAGAVAAMLGRSVRLFASGRSRTAAGQLDTFVRGMRDRGTARGLADTADAAEALLSMDGARFGEILRQRWERKSAMNPDAGWTGLAGVVEDALRAGATGAKVVGAGGGGWLMVAGPDTVMDDVSAVLTGRHGLPEMHVGVDDRGIVPEGVAGP
ncbi:hypothetical protein ACIBLA_05285 [Streptomyces sp. NPDC050433]|uniref:GHMP family kinase ATP-binding protein n=1 Tax=unclassified Streptomyces TaxID=2593676 RepID=UPI00343337CC